MEEEEEEVSQDAIWAAADAEQNEWQNLLSSKEWQSTDRHFAICEQKVAAIFEKSLSN